MIKIEDIKWNPEKHLIGTDPNYLAYTKVKGDVFAVELAVSARIEVNKIIKEMTDFKLEPFRFMTGNLYANRLDLEKEWRIAQKLGYVHRPFSEIVGKELVGWNDLMVRHATELQEEIDIIRGGL